MKCPVCQEKGLKSNVYPGGGQSTLMGFTPYYDEEGNYHIHDPNTITFSYSCSLGHKWKEVSKKECPSCEYGEGSSKTIIDQQNETK